MISLLGIIFSSRSRSVFKKEELYSQISDSTKTSHGCERRNLKDAISLKLQHKKVVIIPIGGLPILNTSAKVIKVFPNWGGGWGRNLEICSCMSYSKMLYILSG